MFRKIRTLVSHTLIYGVGNASTRLIGFLLIPLYTRYLTPVDYGVLALVGMLDQILFIVMNMGQSNAMFRTYFQREDPAARDTVLTTSLWLCVTVSLPVGLLGLLLAQPIAWFLTGAPGYTLWVVIGVSAVVFKTVLRLPFAVLRAREASRTYSIYSFARTGVGIVLAIVFVVGLHLGGRGVLLSQLVAEVALCIVLIPVTLRGIPLRFSGHDAKDLLGYGIYLLPSGLLGFMLRMSDRFFLKYYGSLRLVGLYALGYRFGEIISFTMWAFQLAWPQFLFANRKSPDAPALYARVFTYVLAALGFIWLAIALLAKEIVGIMAAPAFREAYRVVPWVAASFLFEALASVGNVGMPLHRKVKWRPLILATVAGLDIGLNFFLVPAYGAIGAAASLLVSFFVKFLLEIIVGYQLFPLPFEYGRLARLSLVGAAVYGIGIFIESDSLWVTLPVKGLLLLCAPVILYATGFFEARELDGLRGSLGSLRRRSMRILEARGGNP